MNMEYLFAYGTLLTGTGHPHIDKLVRRCRARSLPAYMHGRLYDLGPYPGARSSASPAERVYGEVIVLRRPERALPILDRYEVYIPAKPEGCEFVRRRLSVYLIPSRQPLEAWVYLYNRPARYRARIRSGDYSLRLRPAKG